MGGVTSCQEKHPLGKNNGMLVLLLTIIDSLTYIGIRQNLWITADSGRGPVDGSLLLEGLRNGWARTSGNNRQAPSPPPDCRHTGETHSIGNGLQLRPSAATRLNRGLILVCVARRP